MIIDVAYIRQALVIPETTPNSSIEYLIQHYYDYIVEMMNLVTTMEKEEISNTIIEQDITEEELIINNKLTLFQQTLILGIACSLINMQIAIKDITNNEYEYFIQNIDLTHLVIEEDKYILNWCILYSEYSDVLKKYSTNESTVDYVRRLLNLDPEIIPDTQIEFLLDHYTSLISEKLGEDADTTTEAFKEAVCLGIACQLFKTNPSAIIGPKEYEVGDVSESFDTSFTKSSDTWCDLYDSALNDLISSTEGVHGIKSFDRSGARVKYGYYGPQ